MSTLFKVQGSTKKCRLRERLVRRRLPAEIIDRTVLGSGKYKKERVPGSPYIGHIHILLCVKIQHGIDQPEILVVFQVLHTDVAFPDPSLPDQP